MNAETMRELLDRRPFQPFAVRLSSGEYHEVRHPELAVLTKSRMVIAYPEADRLVITSLLHITSVDLLQPA